ncbi:hypothetical protein AURDEDRAFT_131935 [Auricularia subglabra TFB-10046 SS5]|uniref:Uncharacterized protein n=1 Tax=Auricularia subglabra (strain TFB-10046 / SS5) TaxID=717982 RepID=J0CRR9_AURST|nr:hypothetical protein AURDEDRAFT_131935 [Auricularia subglabra TFB-10046 SS5]
MSLDRARVLDMLDTYQFRAEDALQETIQLTTGCEERYCGQSAALGTIETLTQELVNLNSPVILPTRRSSTSLGDPDGDVDAGDDTETRQTLAQELVNSIILPTRPSSPRSSLGNSDGDVYNGDDTRQASTPPGSLHQHAAPSLDLPSLEKHAYGPYVSLGRQESVRSASRENGRHCAVSGENGDLLACSSSEQRSRDAGRDRKIIGEPATLTVVAEPDASGS